MKRQGKKEHAKATTSIGVEALRHQHLLVIGFLLLVGLFSACATNDGENTNRLQGYLTSDPCRTNTDEATCVENDGQDSTIHCQWTTVESCPSDTDCPEGICHEVDPCLDHTDAQSCAADTENDCAWAEIAILCAPGTDCKGSVEGFCFQMLSSEDECACLCPLYCPAGEECPPCKCDCDTLVDDSDGGTCTCACPSCEDGEACPTSCECECVSDGGDIECVEDGTCTCVCPVCAEGEECPPCNCTCEASKEGVIKDFKQGDTHTCSCEICFPEEECPPCECPDSEPDPCLDHEDKDSCLADTDNQCDWLELYMCIITDDGGCQPYGICQKTGLNDEGCTCMCPACSNAVQCSPCECDCNGGTNDSCIPPAS